MRNTGICSGFLMSRKQTGNAAEILYFWISACGKQKYNRGLERFSIF